MVRNTKEILRMISAMDKENSDGKMGKSTKVLG